MHYNVLFISSWYPNKLEPTNGNFVQRHAEAVASQHDVQVLHAIGNHRQREIYVFDEQTIQGVKTLIVYYKKTSWSFINFFRRMKAYAKGFQKIKKPHIVHANVLQNNLIFAVWLKKRYKIPFIVSEHWSALQEENQHTISKVKLKLAGWMAHCADKVIPVSNSLRSGLVALGIPNLVTVPNVIDTKKFTIKESRHAQVRFLHISNLVPLKNADKIIEVAIRLYKKGFRFRLDIGGDGDEQALINKVKKHQAEDYIHVFGEISHQQVANKMQDSDCFILFSDNETQGCVLLEAFSCGKPVIATNVGGIKEIVDENRGILVEKRDEQALEKAMEDFLMGKVRFQNAETIRAYVTRSFSKDKIAQEFSNIYHQVLS